MPADINPHLLHEGLEYVGPEGLELEVVATFAEDAPIESTITRDVSVFEDIIPEVVHWVDSDCVELEVRFDGIGSVSISFPQALDSEINDIGGVSGGNQ
jgi:hypothetical protein